jgi:signal transduction histidine kinase
LKRQDAEYFGGLQEQVLERDGYAMLINAKERERSRLASEIHDDFSQRLALMALELENAQENDKHVAEQGCPASPQCLNSASEIGADLHTLSHRLHSSTLERLGLVPGIKALCKEFEVQQGIEIDFLTNDVPRSLHPNVALWLFRIAQEGLRNIKRHSGAVKAQIRLRKTDDKLFLSVSDEGVGFDVRELGKKEGIISMEERAYLLGGRLEIHSKPGKGTRIEASVPLQPKSELQVGWPWVGHKWRPNEDLAHVLVVPNGYFSSSAQAAPIPN